MTDNGASSESSSGPGPSLAAWVEAMAKVQQQWLSAMLDHDDTSDAMAPLFAEAAQQWGSVLNRAGEAWSAEMGPTAVQVMDRFAHGQQALASVYQLVVQAWQEALANTGEGGDVAAVLEEYGERVDEQARKAVNVWSQTTQDTNALWQKYLDGLQQAGLPHSLFVGMAPGSAEASDRGADPAADAFFESLYKLFEFETLSERLLDAPALGLSREFTQDVAQGFKAFQEHQRAAVRYRSILASITSDAVQHFLRTLGTRIREGEGPQTLKELSKLWTRVADKTFVQAFRTDDYVDAQNDYLEASLRLRRQQRTIAEAFQRALDQPTRSELEEVYALLHRLRQENKELKREVAALQATTDDLSAGQKALQEEMDSLRRRAGQTEVGGAPDDLTAVPGIGAARQATLHAAGITTYAQLADAEAERLREAFGASIREERLQKWKSAARELAG